MGRWGLRTRTIPQWGLALNTSRKNTTSGPRDEEISRCVGLVCAQNKKSIPGTWYIARRRALAANQAGKLSKHGKKQEKRKSRPRKKDGMTYTTAASHHQHGSTRTAPPPPSPGRQVWWHRHVRDTSRVRKHGEGALDPSTRLRSVLHAYSSIQQRLRALRDIDFL